MCRSGQSSLDWQVLPPSSERPQFTTSTAESARSTRWSTRPITMPSARRKCRSPHERFSSGAVEHEDVILPPATHERHAGLPIRIGQRGQDERLVAMLTERVLHELLRLRWPPLLVQRQLPQRAVAVVGQEKILPTPLRIERRRTSRIWKTDWLRRTVATHVDSFLEPGSVQRVGSNEQPLIATERREKTRHSPFDQNIQQP